MDFYIPYRNITLEALVSVLRCDRDWGGLTSREQRSRGMAVSRGAVWNLVLTTRKSWPRMTATVTAWRLLHKTVSRRRMSTPVSGTDWRFASRERGGAVKGMSWPR